MNLFNQFFQKFFPPVSKLTPGMYHYQAPPEADFPYRLHLRVDQEGEATLILNASTVLHLNQTAAEYAYHLIQQSPPETIGKTISSRYPVSEKKALEDFTEFKNRLETMISTPDLDPVGYLDVDRIHLYASVTAPYRLDCALTYRLSNVDDKQAAPLDRVKRELLTHEWQGILQKAWNAGIPHVIFTGGEPTLRPDLAELIKFSEELGMVTGLLTDGLRLTEKEYLHNLLQSGLDHMMILLDPQENQSWEAIRDAVSEDIAVTVHLTVTTKNQNMVEKYLNQLVEGGVTTLSLTADSSESQAALPQIRTTAAGLGLSLVWDLPVPYSAFNPVSIELAGSGESVEGAGKAWIYVEPDGDVLPGQGINRLLGNLVNDSWQQVWSEVSEG